MRRHTQPGRGLPELRTGPRHDTSEPSTSFPSAGPFPRSLLRTEPSTPGESVVCRGVFSRQSPQWRHAGRCLKTGPGSPAGPDPLPDTEESPALRREQEVFRAERPRAATLPKGLRPRGPGPRNPGPFPRTGTLRPAPRGGPAPWRPIELSTTIARLLSRGGVARTWTPPLRNNPPVGLQPFSFASRTDEEKGDWLPAQETWLSEKKPSRPGACPLFPTANREQTALGASRKDGRRKPALPDCSRITSRLDENPTERKDSPKFFTAGPPPARSSLTEHQGATTTQ